MEEKNKREFVGVGYKKGDYINIRIKKEALSELKTNKYGDIMLTAGQYRTKKGKADIWIAVDSWAYDRLNDTGGGNVEESRPETEEIVF